MPRVVRREPGRALPKTLPPEPESVTSVWGRSDLRDGDVERATGGAVRSLPP